MDIPSSVLIFEHILVGLVSGMSTVAAISYITSKKTGFPKSGFGNLLMKRVFSGIKLVHVALFIVILFELIIWGVLDGFREVQLVYGIKLFILVFQLVLIILMKKRLCKIDTTSPIVVGNWYFLAIFHAYSVLPTTNVSITLSIVGYFVILTVVYFSLFFLAKAATPLKVDKTAS